MAKKYYGVKRGATPGIYRTWAETHRQVNGFPGAIYKGFETLAEAEAFVGIAVRKADTTRRDSKARAFLEVHERGTVTRTDLTDEIRTALMVAGLDIGPSI